jgi:hypothetical protein
MAANVAGPLAGKARTAMIAGDWLLENKNSKRGGGKINGHYLLFAKTLIISNKNNLLIASYPLGFGSSIMEYQ